MNKDWKEIFSYGSKYPTYTKRYRKTDGTFIAEVQPSISGDSYEPYIWCSNKWFNHKIVFMPRKFYSLEEAIDECDWFIKINYR